MLDGVLMSLSLCLSLSQVLFVLNGVLMSLSLCLSRQALFVLDGVLIPLSSVSLVRFCLCWTGS